MVVIRLLWARSVQMLNSWQRLNEVLLAFAAAEEELVEPLPAALANGQALAAVRRVPEDWNRNSPGDRQVANPRVAEYLKRARRAERPVIVMKCL